MQVGTLRAKTTVIRAGMLNVDAQRKKLGLNTKVRTLEVRFFAFTFEKNTPGRSLDNDNKTSDPVDEDNIVS